MSKKWETIPFYQIKQGDRLKIDASVDDRKDTYRGTAARRTGSSWMTLGGAILTGLSPSTASDKIRRRIVKAPEPEPLPTKFGSVILVHEILNNALIGANPITLDPPKPFHLIPTNTWTPVGSGEQWGYHASHITKWEHASIIPTATLTAETWKP